MTKRLEDKVAIVTGGASGIGNGIADCMAKEGAIVILWDIDASNAAKATKEINNRYQCASRFDIVDVTNASQINDGFKRVEEYYERIDILVNNAGIFSSLGMPFTDVLETDWKNMWSMHVDSVRLTATAIKPYFEKQKSGSMINISSIAALLSSPVQPAYAVAKSAVISLSKIVAKEFGAFGARVNVIAPGLVYTPAWEKLAKQLKDKDSALAELTLREVFNLKVNSITLLKTEQTPDDIAWAAVFLASDEARCITGHVLPVDSGVTMY